MEFELSLEYGKDIRKMGSLFAHSWLHGGTRTHRRSRSTQTVGFSGLIGVEEWRCLFVVSQKSHTGIFLGDNASAHMCLVAMTKFNGLGYEFLPRPPYSPDWTLSDLKDWLEGKILCSKGGIISQTNSYFKDHDKSYYLEVVK